MKILQLVQTLDAQTGGVARAVLLLSEALVRQGHAVEILTLDAPGGDDTDITSLKVHALGTGRGGYGYSPVLLPWLREHGGDFDRVIVNGLWQYHGFAAWRRYAGSDIPYYVFPHGMLDPWFKRTYPLKHLKKWIYWPWGEYRVLRDARAVIFTSEQERLEARESFSLYRCREAVSPLGVEAPPSLPPAGEKRGLLFLGRLHPKKGCDFLIDAFARFAPNESFLVMAGPDQTGWRAELEEQAKRAGIAERVRFAGMLKGEAKWAAFNEAEAFILPSHQENFALAVAEALACGVPVLISDRVNIWREIEADGAGYVEHDDRAGTERLLERWKNSSPEARATMRLNARRCFETRFQIDRAAESLLRVLQ